MRQIRGMFKIRFQYILARPLNWVRGHRLPPNRRNPSTFLIISVLKSNLKQSTESAQFDGTLPQFRARSATHLGVLVVRGGVSERLSVDI